MDFAYTMVITPHQPPTHPPPPPTLNFFNSKKVMIVKILSNESPFDYNYTLALTYYIQCIFPDTKYVGKRQLVICLAFFVILKFPIIFLKLTLLGFNMKYLLL